ncbi:MAG: C-type lectin domain-containing protein [Kofleriaceae bacterium]
MDAASRLCASPTLFPNTYDNNRYKVATLPSEMVSWDAAKALCETQDARLAVIETMGENEYLATLVLGFADWSWIGLTDIATEGQPLWITNTPLGSTDYQPFNPLIGADADCFNLAPAPLAAVNGRWGDFDCNANKGWICECAL